MRTSERALVVSTIFAFGLMPGIAFSQNAPDENANQSNQSSSASGGSMGNNATQTLPRQITQKLQKQGFTNVQVVPGSFLVSAKDKDGDPVNMVIGPHSMTMFTITSASESNPGSGSRGASSGTGNQ